MATSNRSFDFSEDRFIYRDDLEGVYDKQDRSISLLDEVGQQFLQAGLSNSTVEESVEELSGEYSVSRERVEEKFREFWAAISTEESGESDHTRGGIFAPPEEISLDYPLSLEVQLIKNCNWACDFCYVPNRDLSEMKIMDLEDIKAIIDEAHRNGLFKLRLSGGEATLHPDFNEVIEYATQKGIETVLFTNGSLLDDEQIELFAEGSVETVLMSLHGPERVHDDLVQKEGAFESVKRSAQRLDKAGVNVVLESLASAPNAETLPETAQVVKQWGLEEYRIMPYIATDLAEMDYAMSFTEIHDQVTTIREEHPELTVRVPCAPEPCLVTDKEAPLDSDPGLGESYNNHCGAGLLWASVSHDGHVRHCPHSGVYAGHIDDNDDMIKSVWNETLTPKIKDILGTPEDRCEGCDIHDDCLGGCHLYKVTEYE